MSEHITIVSSTVTGGLENHSPFVVMKVDRDAITKRIEMVEKLTSRRRKNASRPACVSFWSDDVVEIEWLTDLPHKWLSKAQTKKLDNPGVLFTKKVLCPELATLHMARVEVVMSVFWDMSFGVECIAKHTDERYESNTIFYSDLRKALEGGLK